MSFKCTHYYNFHSLADMQRLFINLLVKTNLMKYRMLQPIMRSEKPYTRVLQHHAASVWSRIIKLNDSGNGIMHKRYNIYIYIYVCVCVCVSGQQIIS